MLVFDIDDTLYDLCEPYREAVHEIFDGRYDGIIEQLFLSCRSYSEGLFEDVTKGRMSKEEYYATRNRYAFRDAGILISDEKALEIQHCYQEKQTHLRLPACITELLQILKDRGTPAGIVSNGMSAPQWKKAEILQLTKWIPKEQIVISGDAGYAKPDIRIFETAAAKFGISPEEGWYVGDLYQNDIAPSKKAGWHAVWLNRRRHPLPQEGPRPDALVYSEEELVRWVREHIEKVTMGTVPVVTF